MSTNLQTIHEILKNNEIGHKVMEREGYILSSSATKVYRNKQNKSGVVIAIAVEEDGKFLRVIAPNLYTSQKTDHKLAVLETCMCITCHVKMLQCLFEASNDEISFQIHIPLEDSMMTEKQLMRALSCLVEIADSFDSAFRSAVEKGEVTVSQVMDVRSKKEKLAQLVMDIPEDKLEELDYLFQKLGFSNNSSSTELQ